MKIFSASQIKKWDAFTIANEPITSIDLMERASTACYKWLLGKNLGLFHFRIFCGNGNNGGDGLAIARLLKQNNCSVTVYILELGNTGTDDFQVNMQRLQLLSTDIHFIRSADDFPELQTTDIIIDALFGSGLNKPLKGVATALVNHINNAAAVKIAIDLPTGLFADKSSKGNIIIKATHTLSFQNLKLAFLIPENEMFCGEVHLLHIGLNNEFEKNETAGFELVEQALIKTIYKSRSAFAHKGTYGHAALLCGSYGMMGAAVLSAKACLRSGAGKLTSIIPKCGYDIVQSTVPEAMCMVSGEEFISAIPKLEKYDAVGIGPGIGIHASHSSLLKKIFKNVNKPMVIDADALNIIAANKKLLNAIPAGSIITPHPKEFERLFGSAANDFERLELCKERSAKHNIHIVLKGHYSFISTAGGKCYFNSTGNAGMATGGSGDVLTGILTGLLAQGYSASDAVLLGVYLHGLAGDHAANKYSKEAMVAGDIADCLGDAFKEIAL